MAEIRDYLGNAMLKYVADAWKTADGNNTKMISLLPELFQTRAIVFPQHVSTIDLSAAGTYQSLDLLDILDSGKPGVKIEAWNPVYLNEALAGTNPFYGYDINFPGIFYQKPILYLFPLNLTLTLAYGFNLNFIKLPINTDGSYYEIDGPNDIPFAADAINSIADIATQLYRIDDAEEDVG